IFTWPIRFPVKIFLELPFTALSVALNKSDHPALKVARKISFGIASLFRHTFSFNPVQSYKEASVHGKAAGALAGCLSIGGIIGAAFAGPSVISGTVQAINGISTAINGSTVITSSALTQAAGYLGLSEVGRWAGTSAVNLFS